MCENFITLNYVHLVHGAFQVYYTLLLFCIFIPLIFNIEIPTKNLNLSTLKIIVIYSGTIHNFTSVFSKSPIHILSYFYN